MRRWECNLLAVVATQLGGCGSQAAAPSQFTDLEDKLGKGWQCLAIPNGLSHVGMVFEQRPDKSVFYLDDIRVPVAASAAVAIGTLTTSKHISVGAAVKLLSAFFPSLDASYDYTSKISASITGAEEQVGGIGVDDAAKQWARQHPSSFNPGSRVFVVRESVVASGITYSFDQSTATAISAKLDLSVPKSVSVTVSPGKAASAPSSKATVSPGSPASTAADVSASTSDGSAPGRQRSTVSPPDSAHRVEQTFDPKIAVCIHPDEILLGSNFAGSPSATLVPVREDLGLRIPSLKD